MVDFGVVLLGLGAIGHKHPVSLLRTRQ